MKFTFDRNTLLNEISVAREIISTREAKAITSNILIIAKENRLSIKATDLKVNFYTQVPVQVQEEGSTTVYCDTFLGILNCLPDGEVEFSQEVNDDNSNSIKVKITTPDKKNKFEMRSLSEEDFPEIYTAQNVPYFEVSSKEIKMMINQTAFAVSKKKSNVSFNGVLFEKDGDSLTLVGTDGRRMSLCSKKILAGVSDFPPAIVDTKILNIILKHAPEEGNIFISVVDKMIFFKFGNYEFGSVLIGGTYPDYKSVIPRNQSKSFQVEKSELAEALKRVSLMVEKDVCKVIFNISDGRLKVYSQQQSGSANSEIPCMYAGEDVIIALNVNYVDEPLRVIDTERIAFDFSDGNGAVTMRSEPQSDYIHIIMPMDAD